MWDNYGPTITEKVLRTTTKAQTNNHELPLTNKNFIKEACDYYYN